MTQHIRPYAIIVAAGSGSRLAPCTNGVPKQFLMYKNAPLYIHAAKALQKCACMAGIVFVFPKEHLEEQKSYLESLHKTEKLGIAWSCVAGGKRRQDSVYNGLKALPPSCTHVLIHDSARPFVSPTLITQLCTALAQGHAGVIPALPVTDTIKEVCDNTVIRTPKRAHLMAVQTPQAFERERIMAAHEHANTHDLDVTDDASLFEHLNIPVHVILGEGKNIKITHEEDLSMLTAIKPPRLCTGFGYDVHRFITENTSNTAAISTGRPLKIGGIVMDGNFTIQAHSDGDVLLHALMDALLGAAAEGDIGQHFPDNDATFNNIDSAVLLHEVLRILRIKGIEIQHVDLTIIAQKPKIGPKKAAIQKNIAHLLGVDVHCVNVKATTEEGLGFTGAMQGIKATALVTALAVNGH